MSDARGPDGRVRLACQLGAELAVLPVCRHESPYFAFFYRALYGLRIPGTHRGSIDKDNCQLTIPTEGQPRVPVACPVPRPDPSLATPNLQCIIYSGLLNGGPPRQSRAV